MMRTLAPSSGYSQMPSTGDRMPESHHSRISVSDGKKAYVGADIINISADIIMLLMLFILKSYIAQVGPLGDQRSINYFVEKV